MLVSGPDPIVPISYSANRDATIKVLQSQHVNTDNKTHVNRHSDTVEANKLGMSEGDTRLAGRWIEGSGRMQQAYFLNVPVNAARTMAGFKDKPFSLLRNVVPPPRNLQKSVFPFIEDALFEPGTYQHTVWTSKVDREMLDTSNETEAASFDLLPYHVETRQRTRGPESIRDYPSQQSFLLMLARLRHVVLQDAAEYMWIQGRHSNWKGTKFPLFEAHKDIFNSPAFMEYRQKVWDELDRHNLDSDNDERQTLPIASSPSPSAVGLQSPQPSNEQSVGTLRQCHEPSRTQIGRSTRHVPERETQTSYLLRCDETSRAYLSSLE